MKKILFKFPTRSRPVKFFNCLDNILENITNKEDYQILTSFDIDDSTMEWYKIIQRFWKFNHSKIKHHYGYSANKVEAVNRNMKSAGAWDILVVTSDDMTFIQKGFDDIIRKDMADNFPDTDGVLHYNDGNQKGNVMTLSIMGRKYYDRFNYVYHPDYQSVWCDVEATEVAYMLGRYKYMGDDKILFRHLHPAWGLTEYDEQYRKSENLDVWGADLATLIRRKTSNYYLRNALPLKYPLSDIEKWKQELNNARINNGLIPYEFNVSNHGYSKNS